MAKQKLKILANCLPMIAAIVFLGAVFMVHIQPEFVNEIGNNSISIYKLSYSSEAKSVLAELAQNKTDDAVKLLQTKKWKNVLLDDRPYYLKREVLRSLCKVFRANKEYKKLLYWVSKWRDIDGRDVDAMALWYEALSHTIDRHQEGIKGLSEGQKKFPANVLFQKFFSQSLNESGESIFGNANFLNKQKIIVQNAMGGWELRWRWKIRHVAIEPIAELQRELVKLNFGGFWNALLKIFHLLIVWGVDESAEDKGYKSFRIFPDKDNWMKVTAGIPRHMTTLRIDFPPFFDGVISDFNLTIDGVLMPVSGKTFEYVNATAEQNSIISAGSEDARFQLNISSLDRSGDGPVMTVDVRFKLLINDLLNNRTLVSHQLALNSLATTD